MSTQTLPEAASADQALRGVVVAPPTRQIVALIETWQALSVRLAALLRDPPASALDAQVGQIDDAFVTLLDAEPDRSLLLLVHTAASETQRYSVTHALAVATVCELAARHVDDWDGGARRSLRLAALTMNIAMTRLQDELALQDAPPSDEQRAQIDGHAERGAELLRERGVRDEQWLTAVTHHHDAPPGALATQPLEIQLARILKRTDIFVARLSPRRTRKALSATAAAKGAYFDEQGQPDEAGAVIIKAVGIYPPGSYVKLQNDETAVVLNRGERANTPTVASTVRASGIPYIQPMPRDTRMRTLGVTAGVPPNEVMVRTPMEKLLRLVR
ncbi:MAG: HD domain-containing protein [Proteobacteria bacterium]|nr:HD domain-containing protein [Pseudomonadota bacterium]